MPEHTERKYLKTANLTEPKTLTITNVMDSRFTKDGNEEIKKTLSFKEVDYMWTLNTTNENILVVLAKNDDSSKWVGTKIEIAPAKTTYKGEPINTIRITDSKLKALNLADEGEEFTIVDIKYLKVKDSVTGELKGNTYLYFSDGSYMDLNKTNRLSIEEYLGTTDKKEWIGKSVVLYPTTMPKEDKLYDVIRARTRVKKQKPVEATAKVSKKAATATDDDIPF